MSSANRAFSHKQSEEINKRIAKEQNSLAFRMETDGVVDTYLGLRQNLPDEFTHTIRNLANAYRPPGDSDDSSSMDPEAAALDYGVTIGTILGLKIAFPRPAARIEYFNRAHSALSILTSTDDGAYDTVDNMARAADAILDQIDTRIKAYNLSDGEEDPFCQRAYEVGIGYMASIGVDLCIEAVLAKVQTPDLEGAQEIAAQADEFAARLAITEKDVLPLK